MRRKAKKIEACGYETQTACLGLRPDGFIMARANDDWEWSPRFGCGEDEGIAHLFLGRCSLSQRSALGSSTIRLLAGHADGEWKE